MTNIYNAFDALARHLPIIDKKAEEIEDGSLDNYGVVMATKVRGFSLEIAEVEVLEDEVGFSAGSYLDIEVLAAYVEDCSVCGNKRVEKLNEEFPGCVIFVLPMTEYTLIQQNEAKFNS